MSITDKTRNLLWVRSGNHCALCGRRLTEGATATDPAAVLADACRIISKLPNGPRYDPHFAGDRDADDNLLLLCVTDHRRVDTQVGTYFVEKLRQLKANHEADVATALDNHFAAAARTTTSDRGFDNYRTEIYFVPDQPEGQVPNPV